MKHELKSAGPTERCLNRRFMHVKQSRSRRRWMETLLNPAEAAAPAAQRRNVSPRPASQFPLRQVGRPIGTLETIRRPLAVFDAAPAGGNPRLTAPLRLSVGDWSPATLSFCVSRWRHQPTTHHVKQRNLFKSTNAPV